MKNNPRNNKADTEQSGERISSLMDGGLDDSVDVESCLDHLVENKEASHCWERYHLIGDALKRNLPPVIDNQLASRVMAELESEPTVLAPSRTKLFLGKQMAGLAVAASVATVAVLGVQFMYKEDVTAPSPQVAQIQGSPLLASKVPVNKELFRSDIQTVTQTMNPVNPRSQQLTQPLAQPLTQQHPAQILKQYHPNINKYLLNHNQRAARGVVQGVTPYARIITYPDMERIARQQNYLQSQSQTQK
jgi:sigma-E factor negative regulatory protein RseA